MLNTSLNNNYPDFNIYNTFPKILKYRSDKTPNEVALRDKDLGIWNETTWRDYNQNVSELALGLEAEGFKKGQVMALIGDNKPAWVFFEIAVQANGGMSLGIYRDTLDEEVSYLVKAADVDFAFAEDQEQVDKALEVIDQLPKLEKIVYFEDKGLYSYDHPKLMRFDEFLDLGKSEYESFPEYVDQQLENLEDDDVAFLVYTSGTTGKPKGSMITHGNIAWVATQIPNFSLVENVKSKEPQFLSYLPLCHIFGRLIDLLVASHTMATINFAESIDTVQSDLVEIQPTIFPAVPRILERMHSGAMVRMKDATFLKRQLFKISLFLGNIAAERKLNKSFNDPLAKILLSIGWILSFRTLKKKLGLSKAETAISGAAPIAPEILKFFLALGVPIFEGYGMTENCGFATGNNEKKIKLGTVGVPNHGMEVKLAEDGEVLTRGGAVFKGYFKNAEATKEVIDQDGWLHTGDVGVFEGEFLKIVDRKKDIIITSGGKNVSPQEIENKIKISPFIKDAIVIGDKRKFLSALIAIEFDTVSNWALRKNIPHTTYRDLSEKKEVRDLVWSEINKANEQTSSLEIRKFRMIPKELDHEDGELTATQKIKRNVLMEQFSDLIEGMYS